MGIPPFPPKEPVLARMRKALRRRTEGTTEAFRNAMSGVRSVLILDQTQPRPIWTFLESSVLWAAIGAVVGIMATIIYGWVLTICGFFVVFAFWRAGVVRGQSNLKQFAAYSFLIASTFGILYMCYRKINVARPDVIFSDIRIAPDKPNTVTLELVCANESDVPADLVSCNGSLYFVPTEDGQISRALQESLFQNFQGGVQINPEKFAGLGPHKTRSGFKTIPFSRDDWKALSLGTKTLFIPTLIFWSDENGVHRREACHWMKPPDSPAMPIVQTHFPICDGHNVKLY
jgi:hypothetical protein